MAEERRASTSKNMKSWEWKWKSPRTDVHFHSIFIFLFLLILVLRFFIPCRSSCDVPISKEVTNANKCYLILKAFPSHRYCQRPCWPIDRHRHRNRTSNQLPPTPWRPAQCASRPVPPRVYSVVLLWLSCSDYIFLSEHLRIYISLQINKLISKSENLTEIHNILIYFGIKRRHLRFRWRRMDILFGKIPRRRHRCCVVSSEPPFWRNLSHT